VARYLSERPGRRRREVSVVSLDLAARSWADNGLAVLRLSAGRAACELVSLRGALAGAPAAEPLAAHLSDLASTVGARVILVDRPQGWKFPHTELLHQRVCEKALHTPGKTGLPGDVRPRPWTRFVRLSVELFDALASLGWPRLARAGGSTREGFIVCPNRPEAHARLPETRGGRERGRPPPRGRREEGSP